MKNSRLKQNKPNKFKDKLNVATQEKSNQNQFRFEPLPKMDQASTSVNLSMTKSLPDVTTSL